MAVGPLAPALGYIHSLCGIPPPARQGDRQLLERFAAHGDEAAFAALVRRHGPMVLSVCRRVLGDAHAAEDAFQATFLLLVRKAGRLRQPDALSPWLHGVAYRTALKARRRAARRRERPLPDLPAAARAPVESDLRAVLDAAIDGLPAKYRGPVVFCYLQGMTYAEAARRLGCPPNTLATRLARARERLRRRLTRLGLAPAAGLLAAGALPEATAAVPADLLRLAVRFAAAFAAGRTASATVPASVLALTKGVGQAMLMDKLKLLGAVMVLGMAGAGAGVLTFRAQAEDSPAKTEAPRTPATTAVPPQPTPTAEAPLADRADAPAQAAEFRTANFRVLAPNHRIARLVGEAAERHRRELARVWLGVIPPNWTKPCIVKVRDKPDLVKPGSDGRGGVTHIEFTVDEVHVRGMVLIGPLDDVLTNRLPHEMTHVILALEFGQPVPRWADEGAAMLAEDESEQQKWERLCRDFLDNRKGLPLRRLFAVRDFQDVPDVMVLYAQAFSVTRYLVERNDRATFRRFLRYGLLTGRWDRALKDCYGFDDIEALEQAWTHHLRGASPSQQPPSVRGAEQPPDVYEPGSPPQVTWARVVGKGLGIGFTRPLYRRKYVTAQGIKRELYTFTPADEDELSAEPYSRLYPLHDVRGFRTKGTELEVIEPGVLAEMLQKLTLVVVYRADEPRQSLEPTLRVVKDGTIVLLFQKHQSSNPAQSPTPRP